MIVICYLPLYCKSVGRSRVTKSVLHAARMKGKKSTLYMRSFGRKTRIRVDEGWLLLHASKRVSSIGSGLGSLTEICEDGN